MSTLAIATAKEVFDLLRDDLSRIEFEFEREALSDVSAIAEIAGYLREGGGKRIRPSLLLLAAKALGFSAKHPEPSITSLGAVVEMIHTATLVHDDIIDEANVRRGRPSANTAWGNGKCVLAGDWLYMQAFRIALEQRNFKVLDLLIGLTQQMVEGEMIQMEKLGRLLDEDEYYDLIYRKTACLFHVSMRLGAVLAGADEHTEKCMGDYGRKLGIAFQIVDDVLDLTATEEVLGKPVASDLREGKATLAVIHAVEHGSPTERTMVQNVLEDRAFVRATPADVLTMLQRNGSIRYAMAEAYANAEAARDSISGLPESEFKRALLWVPDFVVARDR